MSYDGQPYSSDISEFRLLLPDRCCPSEFSDDEIRYLIDTYGSVLSAACCAAGILVGKYANCVDKTIGKVSIKSSQKSALWKEREKCLIAKKKEDEISNPEPEPEPTKVLSLNIPKPKKAQKAACCNETTSAGGGIFSRGWLDVKK